MTSLATVLDRLGTVAKHPPIWAVVAGGLVAGGGRRGRDAAGRGAVGYGVAAVLANVVIKPAVHRRRPVGADQARVGPVTSSFPSGHAATDLAFIFGVSQRIPVLFPPLAACTFAAHWSLARTRAHHVTDILAGGALGIGVAVAVGLLWPKAGDGADRSPNAGSRKEGDDERLMTTIDGEPARLLVHIERIDDADGAPDDQPGSPSLPE